MELIELALDGRMTAETFTELAFLLLPQDDAAEAVAAILHEQAKQRPITQRERAVHFRAQKPHRPALPAWIESFEQKWKTIVDGWEQ